MYATETYNALINYLPLIPFTRRQYQNCVAYVYAAKLQNNGMNKKQAFELAYKCAGIHCQKPSNEWIETKIGFYLADINSLIVAHHIKTVKTELVSGHVVNYYEQVR